MTPRPGPLSPDARLRSEILDLLGGGHAHVSSADALAGLPEARVNERAGAHSLWDVLWHLRFTQADILEFVRSADYADKDWPADYWPAAPAGPGDWDRERDAFVADLAALQALVRTADLFAELPHAPGYTLLREALLAADHNAYHVGQVVALRRQLGLWPPEGAAESAAA